MDYFVNRNSIVRKIWGKSDTVLIIFAGAAAEFALSKAVDCLYFTGRLPTDPLGRLFSTVTYARKIIFAENKAALRTIDSIYQIHKGVEQNRGTNIPSWAYRDVLYMLVYYSITSYELLERKLTAAEKEEVYDVFYRFGCQMKLEDLAPGYQAFARQRNHDLENDLEKSRYTTDLFQQYKKHLGRIRYFILIEAQKMIIPAKVRQLLGFKKFSTLLLLLPLYKFSKALHLDSLLKNALLPPKYKEDIDGLDVNE